MKNKKLFIEFLGSPGVGKSFVLANKASRFREKDVWVISSSLQGKLSFSVLRLAYTLVGFVRFSFSVLRLFGFSASKTNLLLMRNWWYTLGVFWFSQRFKSCAIDQGFTQLLWSFAYRQDNDEELDKQLQFLEKLFSRFNATLNVIHVTAPKEIILGRLHERSDGKSPLESATTKEVEFSMKIVSSLVEQLSNYHFVNMISLSNMTSTISHLDIHLLQ